MQKHPGKVRVYEGSPERIQGQQYVQGFEGSQKRVLCMAERARVPEEQRRPEVVELGKRIIYIQRQGLWKPSGF